MSSESSIKSRCALPAYGFVVVLLLLQSGCATFAPVDKTYAHAGTRLDVDLPHGWLRFNPERPLCTITRDGLRLEKITVRVTKMDRKIPGTERVYRPSMLPQEIAELSLGLTESSDQTKNFEIQSIELADVAGYDGYRARAEYVDSVGLRKRLEIVGAPIQNYVCELIYIAADEVYFDRYYKIFADVVTSARVKPR